MGAVALALIGASVGLPVVSARAAGGQVALDVTPATGLIDGETVTVVGHEFVLNGQHRVLQCVRGATVNGLLHENRCDASTTVLVTADAQGSFTTPFAVAATITTQFTGGAVDCVVIGACELVAVFATNSGPPAVEAPIEFAGAVPATTTTTTEPNSSSPCTPPYLPQAWGRGPGGPFTETSGTWGPVSGVEGKIWWDGTYPGAVPTPPPGIAVPSPVYGVIEVPSLGVFAMYADTHGSWFVIVLMNSDQVLSLAEPFGAATPYRVVASTSGVYLEAGRTDSSQNLYYRWRLDDPCAAVDGAQAAAVGATPAFTG